MTPYSNKPSGSIKTTSVSVNVDNGRIEAYSESNQVANFETLEVLVQEKSTPKGNRNLANNQYFRKFKVGNLAGIQQYQSGNIATSITGVIVPGIQVSVAATPPGHTTTNGDATLRANSKFLEKVRSSDLNLATSLAEGKQTVSMVAQALRSVVRWRKEALKALAGLATPLRSGSKAASNLWLQKTYGWSPLMQDVYGLASFQSNYLRERIVTARGACTEVWNEAYSEYGWKYQLEHNVSRRTQVTRRLRVTNSYLIDLERLTSLNPLAIAWELTPYSFVADWFFDIGSYLQQLETAAGLGYSVVDGFDTYGIKQTTLITGGNANGKVWGGSTFTSKQRLKMTGFPQPVIPKLQVKLGASRILSAAALVRQRF